MGEIGITGGQGFVGSHVAKYLDSVEYKIRFITRPEFLNQEWSVLDGLEYVVHSAWCMDKDLQSIEHLEFAEWTCNFFNECKKRGIRVINMGSSSEYGVKDEPMCEDMICEPISAYGIAKLSVTLYAKLLGFNTLRLFSPFGDRGKNFVSLMEQLEKFGNPKDNRDYFPVEVIGHAVERLLHAKHLYGEIINVCSGINIKHEMLVEKKFGNWYTYKQNQFEPKLWVGDTAKMERLLNL